MKQPSLSAPAQDHRWIGRHTLAPQFARFLTSGGTATAIHLVVMALLIGLNASALAATLTGAVAGAALNYGMQARWVFAQAAPHRHTVLPYLASVLLAWIVNAVVFHLLCTPGQWHVVWAQAGATAAVAILNFTLYKRFVFHERPQQNPVF